MKKLNQVKLNKLRQRIDAIDVKMVCLLNERAAIALAIGKEKLNLKVRIRDYGRESEVLERVEALNNGPLTDCSLKGVYRKIIRICSSLQKQVKKT